MENSVLKAKITNGFWAEKLKLNAETAIFHQWEMLEATHCIDNFRIAAGLKEGFREGFFFSDSDAFKWLDAASRILGTARSPRLDKLVHEFISILEKAQQEDGYLYTYNQIHFGDTRWQNLQIEHEFYCLGHLIEAGISHTISTGSMRLLTVAKKAADLLLREFWETSPLFTDGHEEIEIALIKMSRHTGDLRYRELAKRLLQRRGEIKGYAFRFLSQTIRSAGRMNKVAALRKQYYRSHPGLEKFKLPAHNKHLVPKNMTLRFASSALSGKYTQQHTPLDKQFEPVGHAVRFTYLNTAEAMLARDDSDLADLQRMKLLWQHMVDRRMSVSGGIGSLPLTEGFGRDYELDPEIVYNETCAALGCMLWNREMSLLTGEPKYDDLFEWQLYNAASVGIGQDGCSYFYNNPLTSHGGIKRESWYDIPCCPSNLSRVWASLADHVVAVSGDEVRVHQYFGGEFELNTEHKTKLIMTTALPWAGSVKIQIKSESSTQIKLSLRKPAWTDFYQLKINGQTYTPALKTQERISPAACGLNLSTSSWLTIEREFNPRDMIEIDFDLPIRVLRQDERIAKCGGLVAISRGPILFCLEGNRNSADLERLKIVSSTLEYRSDGIVDETIPAIFGKSPRGKSVVFTPYYLWGNGGNTTMTVFTDDRSE